MGNNIQPQLTNNTITHMQNTPNECAQWTMQVI